MSSREEVVFTFEPPERPHDESVVYPVSKQAEHDSYHPVRKAENAVENVEHIRVAVDSVSHSLRYVMSAMYRMTSGRLITMLRTAANTAQPHIFRFAK